MSAHAATPEKTRTAPRRNPDGFPFGWYRYRNYVLFAFTSLPLALGGVGLLEALHALGKGEEAWNAWLAEMARPFNLALSLFVLAFALYFVIRFAWVGRKIAVGRIGPIPGPPLPMPLLGAGPLLGAVPLWLIVFAILGGLLF